MYLPVLRVISNGSVSGDTIQSQMRERNERLVTSIIHRRLVNVRRKKPPDYNQNESISEEEGSIPGSGMACSASGSIFEANFPPSIGIKVRYRYKFLAVTKP